MCRSYFTPWSLRRSALPNAASLVPQRSIVCCAKEQSLLSNKIESLQISQLNRGLSDYALSSAIITHKTIIPTNHTTHSRHDCGPSHESSGPDGILKPLSNPFLNFSHAVMTIQNLKLQLTQPCKSNQKKKTIKFSPPPKKKPGFNQLSL